MKRRSLLRAALAGTFATALTAGMVAPAYAAYPERPITMIVPWGAGGGTDAVARFIASELEKDLKQPINVVNRTGGSGVVGHTAISSAAPDGYTIGLITVEIAMMKHVGLTTLGPDGFTPIGMVNYDPTALFVSSDSKIKDVKDLLEQAKASPGKLKASGTGQGGIWHLGLAGMLLGAGIDPGSVPWVPSNGAAPAMQDLAAGGIDIVTCSLPEARAIIEAGKAKSLAVMGETRNAIFPNVPTLKEATGSDWTIAAWRGIAGPKGMPANIAGAYEATLKKIYDSKEYQDFMNSRGFGIVWADSKGFDAFMGKSNDDLGKVMKAVGLAKT